MLGQKLRYAEVSVNSPIAQRATYSYTIPPDLDVAVGQAVLVPFGDKILQGIVLELTPFPAVEDTREIAGVIDPHPLLSAYQITLSHWISEYYLSPLFDAVSLMLPPGFERRGITFFAPNPAGDRAVIPALTDEQRKALGLIDSSGKISLRELEKEFGARRARAITAHLARAGLIIRSYELERIRVKPKMVPYLRLVIGPAEAREAAFELRERKSNKKAGLLGFLAQQPQPVAMAELRKRGEYSAATVKALVSKGLARVEFLEVKREPISYEGIIPSQPLTLKPAQKAAWQTIKASLMDGKEGHPPSVFLIHGVTGSGKTELYLQALTEVIRQGKRGIVLVPEIALTPQTIERFAARFPHKVAVLHSKLTLGEQFDEWRRIKDGEFDVVIGPRSAIFAPQPDLGLIVIDEEHEWTYKQSDKSPRYHVRDVAIKLAELTGSALILGTATPDVETYYHAQKGDYSLLELPERIAGNGPLLPRVEVVDLREELKAGNRSLFSRSLARAASDVLNKGEQAILFINRRGTSTFVQCRNCGFVMRCKRCEVVLTYHSVGSFLVCHQCNYRMAVPMACPQCSSPRLKFLGTGIQKVEQEAGSVFQQARLLRWDSDVTKERHSHEKILGKFRNHEADILIGTQMIAKGLDLPLITLVGVVDADTSLNLPDLRAGERTFQVLCQVAGRAGRSSLGGRVIIQTYSPEHYSIRAAAKHDYASFYKTEIDYRRQLNNPPFSRLASLTYVHTNDARCQREAERMKDMITEEIASRGLADLSIVGPAPAFIHRLRGRFRWQIILRGAEPSTLLSQLSLPRGWTVDIDPVSLI